MKVYIVMRGVEYEGEAIHSVFADYDKADKYAEKEDEKSEYDYWFVRTEEVIK